MIDLTPLEVRKKKGDFRKAMRGYEPQAVDDFLDLVADRLEQLVRENASLQERVGSITQQVSDYRERERALTEALVTAQEMREQMRQQVEREVELKLREAEADAEAVRTLVAQQREREEENIRRLRARQSQFVQSYRNFLERELAELAVMTQTLDMSMQDEAPAPQQPRKRARKAEAAAPEPAAPAAPIAQPEPVAPRVAAVPPVAAVEPLAPLEPAAPEPPVAPRAAAPEPPSPALFDEPIPMPLPEAIPDEIASSSSTGEFNLDPFEEPDHELIDLSAHFPPTEDVTPSYITPDDEVDQDLPPLAELSEEEEIMELELLEPIEDEEPKKDDDADGWVSTLLEGKG